MKRDRTTVKVALSAALLVLSILVSLQITPSGPAGKAVATQTVAPLGRLLVSVALNNQSTFYTPWPRVQVEVTQFLFHGIHLILPTNGSGESKFGLPAGSYGVAVSNEKFSLSTSVPVNAGQMSKLEVTVNRTSYYASFASASDSTSQGFIEPWNTLVMELRPFEGFIVPSLANLTGGIIIPAQGQSQTVEKFGPVVFVQPVVYNTSLLPGFVRGGTETPANVIAQQTSASGSWVTLEPTRAVQVSGAADLAVISYRAGSSVSFANV